MKKHEEALLVLGLLCVVALIALQLSLCVSEHSLGYCLLVAG